MFARGKTGCLYAALEKHSSTPAARQVANSENQRKALWFAKKLFDRKDLSAREKAQTFDLQMLDWAATFSRQITDSAVNCLRELAVAAIKAERQASRK